MPPSTTPNITLCWTCIHDKGGCQHPKKDDPVFWAKPTEKCYKPRRVVETEIIDPDDDIPMAYADTGDAEDLL